MIEYNMALTSETDQWYILYIEADMMKRIL